MIDIAEFTNAELEEMGFPVPCDCRNLKSGPSWWECPDCGYYDETEDVSW